MNLSVIRNNLKGTKKEINDIRFVFGQIYYGLIVFCKAMNPELHRYMPLAYRELLNDFSELFYSIRKTLYTIEILIVDTILFVVAIALHAMLLRPCSDIGIDCFVCPCRFDFWHKYILLTILCLEKDKRRLKSMRLYGEPYRLDKQIQCVDCGKLVAESKIINDRCLLCGQTLIGILAKQDMKNLKHEDYFLLIKLGIYIPAPNNRAEISR